MRISEDDACARSTTSCARARSQRERESRLLRQHSNIEKSVYTHMIMRAECRTIAPNVECASLSFNRFHTHILTTIISFLFLSLSKSQYTIRSLSIFLDLTQFVCACISIEILHKRYFFVDSSYYFSVFFSRTETLKHLCRTEFFVLIVIYLE